MNHREWPVAAAGRRGEGKSVLIIGGGIAGLSAGCYAQMNGYRSQVLEMHTIPGGLCTSWRRKGYTMDGCLQYVTGTNPQADINRLWRELGALRGRRLYDRDEFTRVEDADGRSVAFYTDVNRFEEHLLAHSPADRLPIRQLCNGVRAFSRLDMPLDMPLTPEENLEFGKRMLPFLAPVLRWNRVGLRDFAQRFRDPLLGEALRNFFQFAHPTFPLTVLMMTLAQMHNRDAGYPLGGSLRFALGIARRYEELGGALHTRTRVKRILVEEGGAHRAVGVELENGERVHADYVIAANDGYDTIFTMLEGKYVDGKVLGYYREMPVAGPIVQISIGANLSLRDLPHSVNLPMAEARMLAGTMQSRIVPKHFGYDPAMAPEGKSVVTLWMKADYDYWRRAAFSPSRYDEAQDEVADHVVEELDRRIPGFAAAVEVVDVATPTTYERITENWQGAIGGWTITRRKMSMMMGKGMRKQLPGLERLYMCGQWVEPAGNVQLSAASGRDAVKLICAEDGRPFVTEEAPALPSAQAPGEEVSELPRAAHADPAERPSERRMQSG